MSSVLLIVILAMAQFSLTACGNEAGDAVESTNNQTEEMRESSSLVDNPSEAYIIECLESIPNINGVAAVTEDNDPNGDLNTQGGYYAAVFFSSDLITAEGISGDDLINKGTDAGGCIEAFKTVEDAQNRNDYLAEYDDSWLLKPGSHTVIGTLVVRTSKDLSEDNQRQLESNIISVLIGGDVEEPISQPESEKEQETESTIKETDASEKTSRRIIMPNSTSDYIGSEWTIDTIIEHFKELGFTNIKTVPCEPDDDNFDINIFEMVIETGWFSTDPWEAGDEFDSDAEITIYYNEFPLLTVENCPDLLTILTSKDMSYITFCNTYDGHYVRFDAYVVDHLTYDGGTSHIIDVTGGDYDGITELDAYDSSTFAGLIIRIGDRTWGNSIDESVEIGDHVSVSGKIDASWADYYDCMYVETMSLSKR